MLTLRLQGLVTALSPIHISPPNAGAAFRNGHEVGKNAHETIYRDGRRVEVPCIPGSTLRGGLRRAAAHLAKTPDFEEGRLWRAKEYIFSNIGGSKDDDTERSFTFAERREQRRRNPVIGLFGAGQPWVKGHVQISTAYADPALNDTGSERVVQAELVGGRRTDDVAMNPGILSLMDESAEAEWMAMREEASKDKATKKRIEELAKSRKTAPPEARPEIDAKIAELSSAKTLTNSLLLPLTHLVLPRGVRMRHEMMLHEVTAEEAGLFLAAMDWHWREKPWIGGKIALGYGLVGAKWSLSRKNGARFETIGDVAVEPHLGLTDSPDEAAEWIAAWERHRDSGVLDLAPPA